MRHSARLDRTRRSAQETPPRSLGQRTHWLPAFHASVSQPCSIKEACCKREQRNDSWGLSGEAALQGEIGDTRYEISAMEHTSSVYIPCRRTGWVPYASEFNVQV
jgi:hypothetical protein